MSSALELIAAVKAGDEARVSKMLDSDASLLAATDDKGVSAISLAMYHGRPAVARLFVERGAPLNIFEAAAVGHAGCVQSIVAGNPDLVNACSPDGFHPLALSCFFGHEEIARFLLQHGADVHAISQNAMKVQPIHAAAARRASALVRLLLEHGADPNARQNMGFTALHSAAQNGDESTIEVLLSAGAAPSSATDDGRVPAEFAEQSGHKALAARLGGR